MPGLPPDLEAIFGKIHQKKHFSEDHPPRKRWKNIKSYQRAALVPHNIQRLAYLHNYFNKKFCLPICASVCRASQKCFAETKEVANKI